MADSHDRPLLGRRRPKWVTELHIKLDATDARSLARLREAYGRDGASLIREFIREKYADLQEDSPGGMNNDVVGMPPIVTSRG